MAIVEIVGDSIASGGIYPTATGFVTVAPTLNAGWEWAPYVYPTRVIEAAPPTIGQAELEYHFGRLLDTGLSPSFATYEPHALGGLYCVVWAAKGYYASPLWIGVIDAESLDVYGCDSGEYSPSGVQKWTAYALDHLWDRTTILGVNTDGGWIDRHVPFNRRDLRGLSVLGNRSTTADENGAHTFSSDGEAWTALDVLTALLSWYSPFTVYLDGAYDVLDDITSEWDFSGQTLFDAVNELVDRRRGLGWRLVAHGDGEITTLTTAMHLEIYTQIEYPTGCNGYTVPANQNQDIVILDENYFLKPQLVANGLCAYDQIRVEGERLGVCCSVSYADGSLAAGWVGSGETQYEAVSGDTTEAKDKARTADVYRDVFAKYVVPYDWDWECNNGENSGTDYVVNPTVLPDGTLDYDNQAGVWIHGISVERNLPLYTTAYDGHYEPRTPFVICKDAEGNWQYVDKLAVAGQSSATVQFLDGEMGFRLSSSTPAHLFGLNHFDDDTYDTATAPAYDWQDLIATVFFRTDERLAVVVKPSDLPWADTGRTKVIRVPGAELWSIYAGTVTDVIEGALYRQSVGTNIRDDRVALKKIAAFAAAYYGQLRRTAKLQIDEITLAHPVGHLIQGSYGGGYWLPIGTVVTRREWTFGDRGQQTMVYTGHEELEVGALGASTSGAAHAGAGAQSAMADRVRLLESQAAAVPVRVGGGGGGKVVYAETKDDLPDSPVGFKGVTTGDDKRVYECVEVDEGASTWLCVTHLEDGS